MKKPAAGCSACGPKSGMTKDWITVSLIAGILFLDLGLF